MPSQKSRRRDGAMDGSTARARPHDQDTAECVREASTSCLRTSTARRSADDARVLKTVPETAPAPWLK